MVNRENKQLVLRLAYGATYQRTITRDHFHSSSGDNKIVADDAISLKRMRFPQHSLDAITCCTAVAGYARVYNEKHEDSILL